MSATIISLYGCRLIFLGILQALALSCTLYGPVVLKAILIQVENGNQFDVELVLKYIISLFIVQVVQAIMTAHVNLGNQILTIKLTSALQHLLFQKSLVLNAKCRRAKTTGEIANMFSTDIQWIISFALFTNQIWLVPAQLVVLLAMLYSIIGWAAFIGATVIALTLISNNVLVSAQRRAYKMLMQQKDERMKAINEVFGAMHIIKMNAWEEKFGDKINTLRKAELLTLSRLVIINSMQIGFLFSAPVLVTVASFAIYTLIMQQSMTAAKVFTALSLFTLLRRPMMYLPRMLASLMQALVALKRISEFLKLEEKDVNNVMTRENMTQNQLSVYDDKNIDVQIVNGTFTWDFNIKPLFSCIDLTIRRGEFIVIHGSVGE
ncbi:ATP-binding Cassette (ABC) Superfamily, partial [Thraustotheca clavata]